MTTSIATDKARIQLDKLELDKENRPPRGMAVEKKGKGKGTPGRPKKKANQYFEVGKVGRYARDAADRMCGGMRAD